MGCVAFVFPEVRVRARFEKVWYVTSADVSIPALDLSFAGRCAIAAVTTQGGIHPCLWVGRQGGEGAEGSEGGAKANAMSVGASLVVDGIVAYELALCHVAGIADSVV